MGLLDSLLGDSSPTIESADDNNERLTLNFLLYISDTEIGRYTVAISQLNTDTCTDIYNELMNELKAYDFELFIQARESVAFDLQKTICTVIQTVLSIIHKHTNLSIKTLPLSLILQRQLSSIRNKFKFEWILKERLPIRLLVQLSK